LQLEANTNTKRKMLILNVQEI